MAFVNLTRLDGTVIAVQAFNNFTLEPVPAPLLPPAVLAGTYVTFTEDGTRVAVIGTVAATAAILDAAVSTDIGLWAAQVDAAGNVMTQNQLGGTQPIQATVTHVPASGVYDVQFTTPPTVAGATSGMAVVSILDPNAFANDSKAIAGWTGVPGQLRIETDDAGVLTDRGWGIHFLAKL